MFETLPSGVSADPTTEIRSIEETSTAFVRKVEKLKALVDDKRAALRVARQGDFDRAGLVNTEDGRRVVDKDRRYTELQFIERGIVSDVSDYRRQVAASSQQERDAMLQALNEKLARVDAIAETYPSPTSLLAKHGLGGTEHANLIASLTGAGKAELMARAREAVMTGNRVLASAVLTVNDRRARHERAFASAELAEAVIGVEHKTLLGRIAEARRHVAGAMDLERLFVTGDESPASKIARGLASRVAARRSA
jgi:hypothetical protein